MIQAVKEAWHRVMTETASFSPSSPLFSFPNGGEGGTIPIDEFKKTVSMHEERCESLVRDKVSLARRIDEILEEKTTTNASLRTTIEYLCKELKAHKEAVRETEKFVKIGQFEQFYRNLSLNVRALEGGNSEAEAPDRANVMASSAYHDNDDMPTWPPSRASTVEVSSSSAVASSASVGSSSSSMTALDLIQTLSRLQKEKMELMDRLYVYEPSFVLFPSTEATAQQHVEG